MVTRLAGARRVSRSHGLSHPARAEVLVAVLATCLIHSDLLASQVRACQEQSTDGLNVRQNCAAASAPALSGSSSPDTAMPYWPATSSPWRRCSSGRCISCSSSISTPGACISRSVPPIPRRRGCHSGCAVEGIAIIRTPYHAPNANAYAELGIRAGWEECLDQLLIVNEA
jgi:hypothetical protein